MLKFLFLLAAAISILVLIANYTLINYSGAGMTPARDEKGNVVLAEDGSPMLKVTPNSFYNKQLQSSRGKLIFSFLATSIISYLFVAYRLRNAKT